MATETTAAPPRRRETLESVVIRFAGDSGDGMQLTGSAVHQRRRARRQRPRDLPGLPGRDPRPRRARCRASAASSSTSRPDEVFTPGDAPDVLVAMNPAALKTNLADLQAERHADRQHRRLQRDRTSRRPATRRTRSRTARLERLPASSAVDITELTRRRRSKELGPRPAKSHALQELLRARACATGSTTARSSTTHRTGSTSKFAQQARARRGQRARAQGGLRLRRDHRAVRTSTYEVPPAKHRARPLPQHHRQQGARARLRRGRASSRGCRSSSAATRSRPATDILHELVDATRASASITFQAEDEIAAIGAAIGAAFGGALGVTTTSGPGHRAQGARPSASRSMIELPLVIVDIQRGGPRPGLPTKTEQADLLQAMYGRNGESPGPGHRRQLRRPTASRSRSRPCRIAVKYMTPVILLSDGYLANGAEPWRIPDVDEAAADPRSSSAPTRRASSPTRATRRRSRGRGPSPARPGSSTASAASRRRTSPATSATTRRTTSTWCSCARSKVAGIARDIPPLAGARRPRSGDLLRRRLGRTYGAIARRASQAARERPARGRRTCTCAT